MALQGYVNARYENIPGNETNNPTLSTKSIYFPLQEFDPNFEVTQLDRSDELRNLDFKPSNFPNVYECPFSLNTRAYPDSLGFLLGLALGFTTNYTGTTGNGVITDPNSATIPTGVTKHVWTAPFTQDAEPLTAQFLSAWQGGTIFRKHKGAAVSEIGISTEPEAGTVLQIQGEALYFDQVSNPSLTPALESIAIPPFLRKHAQLTMGLANSAALKPDNVSFSLTNPLNPRYTFGSGSSYKDKMDRGEGFIGVTGSVTVNDITSADFNALRDGTPFTLKTAYTSTYNIGATSYPYKFFIELANAQYVSGDEQALNNSRHTGATFNFEATADGSNPAVKLTLCNATTSYTT